MRCATGEGRRHRSLVAAFGVCTGIALAQPLSVLAGNGGGDAPGTASAAAPAAAPVVVVAPTPFTVSTRTAASGASQASQSGAPDPVTSFFRKIELSGLVDGYYTYNFNEPQTGTFTQFRNFDVRHNQFSVALLEVALSKPATEDDRTGFRFDLNYGQVAQIFNADPLDGDALINVQQAYISYLAPVGKGLTFEFGKFVTPIGSEATEANLNNNYSRAFLYALGPYYHTGARVSYAFSPKFSLGGMLVNGWNATGDNNSGKSVGVTATIAPTSKVSIIQNVLIGPEQNGNADDVRTYSDTNLSFTASDKITTGFNYVYAKDSVLSEDVNWQGLALYLKGQVTKSFALSPRMEWYDDKDGFVTGASQTLKEFTMTGEVKHSSGLILRLEYRRDWSNEEVFSKEGRATDNQNTFTVAFIYPFSSKPK